MANTIQILAAANTSDGYSNGVSSGNIDSWTDFPLSGSHTATYWWNDKGRRGTRGESRVDLTVRNTWNATINQDNSMSVTVTTTIVSMTRTVLTSFSNCDSTGFYNRRFRWWLNGQWRGDLYNNCDEGICWTHNIWSNYDLGSVTFTLAPGEASDPRRVLFLRNDSCGWSQSYDPTDINYNVKDHGWYSDTISGSIRLRNPLPALPPAPTISISCGAVIDTTEGRVDATFSGSQISSTSVVLSKSSTYSPIEKTGTGQWKLQSNTKYYVKASATNPGGTTENTCSFTTYAASSVVGYKFYSDQSSILYVSVDNGAGACAVTTKLYYRKKGTNTWKSVDVSGTGTVSVTVRNFFERGNQYEAYTTSTNCAGTYTSAIYSFAPPAADRLIGEITRLDSELDLSGQAADLSYCYKVTSYANDPPSHDNPINSHIEYRIKGETEWVITDSHIIETETGSVCDTIIGLACGTEYEFRTYQSLRNLITYSAVKTYTTAACGDTYSYVCDNLSYMTELICQELNEVKDGDKTIYANCDTKTLCDPYSNNPTWSSILSRLLRFDQAVTCLICAMDDFGIPAANDDDVYTATERGKYGIWQRIHQTVEENSEAVVSSKAFKDALNAMVHKVWRPLGNYTYFGWDMDFLDEEATDPQNGETAIVGDNLYQWNGSRWMKKQAGIPDLGPFGVIKILKGEQYANSEFYYFNNEWNYLDFNATQEGKRTDFLEDEAPKVVQTRPNEQEYNFIVRPISTSNADIWSQIEDKSRSTVVYLTDGSFVENPFTLDVDYLDGGKELI